jgi:hypothetical protein
MGEAVAAGIPVNLDLVESAPGLIQRRPTPCYTEQAGDVGSKSSISNDMLLGYIAGRWAQGNLAALQRLADYGVEHNWVMGAPFPERAAEVVMKPNQYLLMAKAIERLSDGQDRRRFGGFAPKYEPVARDFEQHLQALSISLYRDLFSGIDADAQAHIAALVAASPNDALFCAVAGDLERAAELLLDPAYEYPTYARGAEIYKTIHWLYAARLVLR